MGRRDRVTPLSLSIFRRAEASMLLEWSRSIEDHRMPLEEWQSKRIDLASIPTPSRFPLHTNTRKGS